MSRVAPLSLLALLAVAALVPSVSAASLAITGLPSSATDAVGTAATLEFTVEVTLDQGECASGTTQDITVALSASVPGAGSINATVIPASMQFAVPPGATLSGSWSASQTGTVTVNGVGLVSATAINATVVAKQPTSVSCQVPVGEPTFDGDASASATVNFKPTGNVNTNNGPTEEPVPGLELPVLAFAVVGLALILRRRKA